MLQHLPRYISTLLDADEGKVPYLMDQAYLSPHSHKLMLLNQL